MHVCPIIHSYQSQQHKEAGPKNVIVRSATPWIVDPAQIIYTNLVVNRDELRIAFAVLKEGWCE